MPAEDGAPFTCDKGVERPGPVWFDRRGEIATRAYVNDRGDRRYLRCEAHKSRSSGAGPSN